MIGVHVRLTALQNKMDGVLKSVPGTLAEATADAAAAIRGSVIDELAQTYNADDRELSSRVYVSVKQDSITVGLKSRPIPLKRFPTQQTDRGVSVRVYRGGRAEFFPSAFGPNIRRLGRGVYRRQGRARLPIKRMPGISLTKDRAAKGAVERAQRQAEIIVGQRTRSYKEQLLFGALQPGQKTPTVAGRLLAEARDIGLLATGLRRGAGRAGNAAIRRRTRRKGGI
jgi:hypothetical protein